MKPYPLNSKALNQWCKPGSLCKANALANFTGKDSAFEEPEAPPALLLDTDQWDVSECTRRLAETVLTRVTG